MITQHAELTEFGRLWAEAMAKDFYSPVARLALIGYESGWPDNFVHVAIAECNRKGAETASCD